MAINPATGLEDPSYVDPTLDTGTSVPTSAMDSVATTPQSMSEMGQEMSEATGTNYSELGKAAETASEGTDWADYNPEPVGADIDQNVDIGKGSSYLTNATDTVAGQMDSLLSKDNPYIQQARLTGEAKAQERGMLNSSLSAGASEREAIKAALPIAQQDAKTYATAAGNEQLANYNLETIQGEAIISGEMVEQKASIAQKSQDINNSFQAQLAGAGEQSKALLGDLQNTFNVNLQNLDAQIKTAMQQASMDDAAKARVSQHSAGLIQNFQVSIENMMTDPDFLQLGSAAINKNIKQMQALAANGIDLIAGYEGSPDMQLLTNEFLSYGTNQYTGA